MLRTIAPCLVILGVFLSGCSSTPPVQETGSLQLTSSPPGADVYLDNEYRGTTPATITAVPAGNHTVEIRGRGYERWSVPVTVIKGRALNISVTLAGIPTTQPVTFATAVSPTAKRDLPQIRVDGYWTYPQGFSGIASTPASLLVHADAFNVGYADAREVTVSANLYYEGRQICWNTVYLGTLTAGGHVSKDTMVTCPVPSGISSPDLVVRFENIIVTP